MTEHSPIGDRTRKPGRVRYPAVSPVSRSYRFARRDEGTSAPVTAQREVAEHRPPAATLAEIALAGVITLLVGIVAFGFASGRGTIIVLLGALVLAGIAAVVARFPQRSI